jgi:hypothetical protein
MGASGGIRTLFLWTMTQVFYHHANQAQPLTKKLFLQFFHWLDSNLPLPATFTLDQYLHTNIENYVNLRVEE